MRRMWIAGENKEFYTPPPKRHSKPPFTCISHKHNILTAFHKLPSGPTNSPYFIAKHAQLIDKDPNRAVALFWNAINSGDRVDSALKDMAVVMKQLDRSNEAIEAIKSFRHLCSSDSQESLDNVLVELYKSGRLEEQIEVLQLKLKRLEEGHASLGKKGKLARSHGKKCLITAEKEYARLLGNLAWAHLQQNDYKKAEDYYRKALSIETDRNKQCNLAICLICMNRITEAKFLLQVIRDSAPRGQMDESYAKSFKRASKLLAEMEGGPHKPSWVDDNEKDNGCQNVGFFAFTPCKKPYQLDNLKGGQDPFAERNAIDDAPYFNQKGTYTPPVLARQTPGSPITQPQKHSILLHSGNWRNKKETILDSPFMQRRQSSTMLHSGNWKNKKESIPESPFTQPKRSLGIMLDGGNKVPISYVPRRLQFGKLSSDFLATTRDLSTICQETERHVSVDPTPDTEVDRKENFSTTDLNPHKLSISATGFSPKTCSGEHPEWVFSSCNNPCRKSWADMVEEDEQEIMHPSSGA